MYKGFALMRPDGELSIATVSETERAAMVNAISRYTDLWVTRDWSSRVIVTKFNMCKDIGKIVPVTITVDEI